MPRHRAAGDEDDLLAGAALLRDLGDELFNVRRIRLLPAVREHAITDLDHDPGDVLRIRVHGVW